MSNYNNNNTGKLNVIYNNNNSAQLKLLQNDESLNSRSAVSLRVSESQDRSWTEAPN